MRLVTGVTLESALPINHGGHGQSHLGLHAGLDCIELASRLPSGFGFLPPTLVPLTGCSFYNTLSIFRFMGHFAFYIPAFVAPGGGGMHRQNWYFYQLCLLLRLDLKPEHENFGKT